MNMISKVTDKPVYYYPHHIDVDSFPPLDLERKMREKSFNVLFVGQNTIRKGLADAVTAYSRVLSDVSDTSMIVKAHNLSKIDEPAENIIFRISSQNSNQPRHSIYLIDEDLSRENMLLLYKNSSIVIHPSRGEGFGLVLAEAMSSGLPCIYTDWSSMPEVCAGGFNYAVKYHLDESIHFSHSFFVKYF